MKRSKSSPSVAPSAGATTTTSSKKKDHFNNNNNHKLSSSSSFESGDEKDYDVFAEISKQTEETDYFARKLPEHLMKDDPSLSFFQKPHTITVMAIALLVLIFGAFTRSGGDTVANVKV